MRRAPRFSHLLAACAVLIALGLGRAAFRYLASDLGDAKPVERLYRKVEQALPPGLSRIGYLSTRPIENPWGDAAYVKATYTYAPRAVVRGAAGLERVVATWHDRAALDALCAEHGLEPVVVDPEGIAVLKPRGSP